LPWQGLYLALASALHDQRDVGLHRVLDACPVVGRTGCSPDVAPHRVGQGVALWCLVWLGKDCCPGVLLLVLEQPLDLVLELPALRQASGWQALPQVLVPRAVVLQVWVLQVSQLVLALFLRALQLAVQVSVLRPSALQPALWLVSLSVQQALPA